MSDHQTVTGTLTASGATSAVFYLRPDEVVAVTATFTGTGKVSLSQVLGQPAQAYRPLIAWTTSQSATQWRNTTNQDLYLVLRADRLDAGGSVAYTLADVAGDQILAEWYTADGTLAFRITDQGPVGGQAGGTLDVRAFGAVGDGVTDDTAAFNAAGTAAGAGVVAVPSGTYRLDGPVNVSAGQTWQMAGATLATTSTTATMFECDAIDDWALVGPFIIDGPGIATGTFKGVRVTDGNRWRIVHPTFKDLSGTGLLVQNSAGAGALRGETGQVIAPVAVACDTGLHFNSGGGSEYCTVVAPNIAGCNIGMLVVAGNTVVSGGSIVDNVIGVQLTGGANHGHGIFHGTNINHNTDHNVQTTDVTSGHTFAACHLYDGAGVGIELVNSAGIVFEGCVITGTVTNTPGAGSSYNYIRHAHCPAQVTITASGREELVIVGCTGPGSYVSGVSISDPGSVFVQLLSVGGETQALTSGVAATLTWANETFDRRGAFAAGVFTVPTAQAGAYRIRGALVFSGTAMDAAASSVSLRVNGAAVQLFGAVAVSTTRLIVHIDTIRYLSPTNTADLRATIVGTTPLFGDGTFQSTLEIARADA